MSRYNIKNGYTVKIEELYYYAFKYVIALHGKIVKTGYTRSRYGAEILADSWIKKDTNIQSNPATNAHRA
jgi:hypothetical protein